MSLPIAQVEDDLLEQALPRFEYPGLFANRVRGFFGSLFDFLPRLAFDDTPEQRQTTHEELWSEGDLEIQLASYYNILFAKAVNRETYNFWRDKIQVMWG
jgi:hypothetical protein